MDGKPVTDDTDLSKPFTREQLDRLAFDVSGNFLVVFDVPEFRRFAADNRMSPVIPVSVKPSNKALNLILSAPVMYQTLGTEYESLQSLYKAVQSLKVAIDAVLAHASEIAEQRIIGPDLSSLLEGIERQQNHILNVRLAAQIGPHTVGEQILREDEMRLDRPNRQG